MSRLRHLQRAIYAQVLRLAAARWLGPEVPGPAVETRPASAPAPDARPAPKTPAVTWTWEALAQPLGLSLGWEDDAAVITRGDRSVALARAALEALALDDAPERAAAYAMLLGVRLGLDTAQAAWSPAIERPEAPAEVWRKEDIPPEHGARTLRLIPALSVAWCAALLPEREVVARPWIDPARAEVPVLEIGRGLHVMTRDALAALPFDEATLYEDARRALFYESYRLAPREVQRVASGRLRASRTTEGLAASRGALMPELDWDAARAAGAFAMPARDVLLVVEPTDATHAEAALDLLMAEAQAAQEAARFPARANALRLAGEATPTLARLDPRAAAFDAADAALDPARCLLNPPGAGGAACYDALDDDVDVDDDRDWMDEEA